MERGRRLPSWMVVSQKPEKQDFGSKLRNTEEENDGVKLIKPRKSRATANRKISKRKLSAGEEEEADSSSSLQLLVRCKERKKRRKRNADDVDGDDDASNDSDSNNDEFPKEKRRHGGRKRRGGEVNQGDNLTENRMGGKKGCARIDSNEVECINGDDDLKMSKPRKSRATANRKISKRKLTADEEEEEADSTSSLQLLVRCKERKNWKKRNDNDVDDDHDADNDNNNDEIPPENRRRGRQKRTGGKTSCAQIDGNDEEVECIDGDDDLTVEDLMSMASKYVNEDKGGQQKAASMGDDLTVEDLTSIAKEYVNEDKERQQKAASLEDDLTVDDLTSIAKEYVNEHKERQKAASLEDDLTVDDLTSIANEYVREDTDVKRKYVSKDKLTVEREVQYVDALCADKYKKRLSPKDEVDSQCFLNENVASEADTCKPTVRVDPAQDMLDLLLGPLLKKPKHEEKKFDVIAEDVSFAYEALKQKQGVTSGAEEMPLTKKKSSLKDKVAMFLD